MLPTQRKTLFDIVCLCIGFLGLQFGFALQAGNMTRILHNYGAYLNEISLFWLIPPLTGTLIQPIIGYLSDHSLKQGKTRIPFLLSGGILSTITLLALTNAELFISVMSPLLFGGLFIFIIDVGFNTTLHPLRTTITDYLPASQQNIGFTIQTFLLSVGAILGSSLSYLLQPYTESANNSINIIAKNVKYAFYIGAVVLLITIVINSLAILKQVRKVGSTKLNNTKKAPIKINMMNKLFLLPTNIWKIGIVQFFSWTAFFLLWVYLTPSLAQEYYQQLMDDTQTLRQDEAGNYTGVLFAYYHLAAGIFALTLPFLFKRWSILAVHGTSLLLGSVGFIWVYTSQDLKTLFIPMLLIGLAWSSILASPFILLSHLTPKNQVGFHFGLFNIFITLPQIIIGLGSGFIIKIIFNNQAIYAIAIGGASLLIAALLSFYYRSSFLMKKHELQVKN